MSSFTHICSQYISDKYRNILTDKNTKKTIHGYGLSIDNFEIGIEFHDLSVSLSELKNKSSAIDIDWVFNVENQFIRHIDVGNYIICEVPNNDWYDSLDQIEGNIFLYTGFKEYIWLQYRDVYTIEISGENKKVWIGEPCLIQDILENTCLGNIVNNKYIHDLIYLNSDNLIPHHKIINARCTNSMYILDDLHREYVLSCELCKNKNLSIKSVAGSGKTTTLLNLAENNKDKKVLYLAFNKKLIEDINVKIKERKIHNMVTKTFDALIFRSYCWKHFHKPDIIDINGRNIGFYVEECKFMPYNRRNIYVERLIDFCNDIHTNDIDEYCMDNFGEIKPILKTIWNKVLNNEIITHYTNRKLAHIQSWLNPYVDSSYDLIMIDETQDFDLIMLEILLRDTNLPRIFVGDTKQAIYQFRGCINAFDLLPEKDTTHVEFYSTFRVGNPACQEIRNSYPDCWMISKSKNVTHITDTMDNSFKYTYLFRTWKKLLQTAENTPNIFIYNFKSKENYITNMYKKIINSNKKVLHITDGGDDDDLPMFLKTLTPERLQKMIKNINLNIVPAEEAKVHFFTTHSYKGLENNNIRIANDIDIEKHPNIHYVAITRGKKTIVIDK